MNTTKTLTAAQKNVEAACEILRCTEKTLPARMTGLGLTVACGRCGGSGHYSYCPMYGTTCFGCSGRGQVLPRITAKVLADCRAKVAAGDLDAYLVKMAERKAARAAVADLHKRAEAVCYKGTNAAAYEAAYQAAYRSKGDAAREISPALFATRSFICDLETLASRIWFDVRSGRVKAADMPKTAARFLAIVEAMEAADRGE